MNIGIPREVKPQEHRIPLIPQAVERLVAAGHRVWVERDAGAGAGYPDGAFETAGARIVPDAPGVFDAAEVLVKVKEPTPPEFPFFREGTTLFSYLHSETRPALVDLLLEKRITAVAFENVRLSDGTLPLLAPMSVIAGQYGVLEGLRFLCNHRGGTGRSIVAYPGLPPAQVVVLGAGRAGWSAASVAGALGARVSLFEIDQRRIDALSPRLPGNVEILQIDTVDPVPRIRTADMVVNAATVPPESERHIIDRKLVSEMKKGGVIVDVTANLKGAVETVDRYTTHDDPVWEVDGVIHYAVTNIPGTVARTASQALSMAVLPFLMGMAEKGILTALKENVALSRGLAAIHGVLTWHEAGKFQNRPWRRPEEALEAGPESV